MDKVLVVAICIFILALAFIYADRTNQVNMPEETNAPKKKDRGGSVSPIIPSPVLNLSIYEDENCTVEVTAIDWGVMSPGESKNKTVYIKNTGNTDVRVKLYASDWVFKDYNGTILSSDYQQYFNLTWNLEGVVISQGKVATAVITLHIFPFIENVSEFAFDIHLIYEG